MDLKDLKHMNKALKTYVFNLNPMFLSSKHMFFPLKHII